MCATTPGDFPVILEIDPHVFVRGPELHIDGLLAAVSPVGVIPTRRVNRIHTRSQRDSDEFQARRYRNIDTRHVRVEVTPILFSGTGPSGETLSTWLRGLPPVDALKSHDFVTRECVAGGLMLMLSSLPPEVPIVDQAGKLLERMISRKGTVEYVSLLADTLADVGWIGPADDHSICFAALEALIKMSGPEDPVPSGLIAEMRGRLATRDLSDEPLVTSYLERILAVTRGDAEFISFRQAGGLRAAKALLLFLLRPAPEAVRGWLREDLNAEVEIFALATIFAGIAYRSTGLPSELRGSEPLQHILYDWIASAVNHGDIISPRARTLSVKLLQDPTGPALTAGETGAIAGTLRVERLSCRRTHPDSWEAWSTTCLSTWAQSWFW